MSIKWPIVELNAQMLAVLGLHETIENVKWDGGYELYVENDWLYQKVGSRTYGLPIAKIRKDLAG